jgi:hypothetical protein|tara:strand:- start:1705 stop:1995 length:291 start_codon:yes stop_codon:yes gene_type:complete
MDDILKNTIDALEGSLGEFTQLKTSLLNTSLEQFEYLFKLENKGEPLFLTVDKKEIEPVLETLQNDLLPMFEESKHEEGIKKIKSWEKLLKEHLEN